MLRRRRTLLALGLVAIAASAAAYTSLAAGQEVETESTCGGKFNRDLDQPAAEHGVYYQLTCSAPVTGFTVVSTDRVEGFETEIRSIGRDGKDGDFKCVGEIPSDGFRCSGKKLDAKLIAGIYNTEKKLCKAPRTRVWVVATGPSGDISRPRRLRGPKCPKPKTKRKAKSRR